MGTRGPATVDRVDIVVTQWSPMAQRDRLIGMMSVSTYREGYSYSDEHVDVLQTIAAQAAVALDNARLYQQSARQTRQLATLNQIGRTLTSSLDPDRVPALIIEQVTDLLNVEEGSLLLADQATGELVFAYTTGPFGQQLLGQRIPRGAGLAAAGGRRVRVAVCRGDAAACVLRAGGRRQRAACRR